MLQSKEEFCTEEYSGLNFNMTKPDYMITGGKDQDPDPAKTNEQVALAGIPQGTFFFKLNGYYRLMRKVIEKRFPYGRSIAYSSFID